MEALVVARLGQVGCRYFGMSHAAYQMMGVLWDQEGNECALIHTHFAPCQMLINDLPVQEWQCPIAARELARRAKKACELTPQDDYVPLRTVYADPHGSVTTDGNVFQAWWKHSETHVERVGYIFLSKAEAIDALEAERKEAS